MRTKEQLERLIGDWNGEDERFISEGLVYSEDDVHEAEEELEALLNLTKKQ
jgi:hypothetical protein